MKVNCCIELPSWKECRRKIENERYCKENGHTQIEEEKPTELERFIYEEEPSGPQDMFFRERLAKLVNYLVLTNSPSKE